MVQVLEVTSREFQANPKTYLDYADKGTQIVIKREQKTSYVLAPIEEELSPALIECIETGLQEIREGKTKHYTMEELKQMMGL